MKKYIYIVVLLILGGGAFSYYEEDIFSYEESKPSRFKQGNDATKWVYLENFYQEKAILIFPIIRGEMIWYEKKDTQKAALCYERYMSYLYDYWKINGNKVNFFSNFILNQYNLLREQKFDFVLPDKKEDYPSEFWSWLDSPVLDTNDVFKKREASDNRLYQDLAAIHIREWVQAYELYKELDSENRLDGDAREMVESAFYYYLLLRAGEIEKSPVYESAVFYVYKKSKELGFSQYYEDPLASPIHLPGGLGKLFGSSVGSIVPDPYVGMSERKYKKLVKEFLQFLKKGEETEAK